MRMIHSNDNDLADDNGNRELSMVLELEAITSHLQTRALFFIITRYHHVNCIL